MRANSERAEHERVARQQLAMIRNMHGMTLTLNGGGSSRGTSRLPTAVPLMCHSGWSHGTERTTTVTTNLWLTWRLTL